MVEGIRGVDVSKYQGVIDWKRVAADGIQFAAIRASIGSIYKDPRFFANWEGAKAAGILTTAYHVVRWDSSYEAQCDNFMALIEEAGGDPDLPLALDVELPGTAGNSPQHHGTISTTLDMYASGRLDHPMIYTGAWWWNSAVFGIGLPVAFNPDLWTASYTDKPILPSTWSDWKFWQYTSSGQVDGIGGYVDLNVWNGDIQSLMAYSSMVKHPVEEVAVPLETLVLTITGLDLNVEVSRL